MGRYQRHIFFCVNERTPSHPKGCCASKGSAEVRDQFKFELTRRGMSGIVRANNAGCLDACAHGVSLVIYPEGIWYGHVTKDDVSEIIDRTIIGGEVIERLLMPDARYAPAERQFDKISIPPRGEKP